MFLTIIIFILILGVLVLVHELGHFFTARKFGMKVEEFGLGFPPKAFTMFRKNGTDYTLNWIPIGGFVKIKGESGENADEEDSFAHKKAWQRFIVLVAGVSMNIIFAWLLLSIGFGIGLPQVVDDESAGQIKDTSILILSVEENSPAFTAGVLIGDKVMSLNGNEFTNIDDFQRFINVSRDDPINLQVSRGNETRDFAIIPEYNDQEDRLILGVGLVKTGIISYPWYEAVWQGGKATIFTTIEIVRTFGMIMKNLFTTGHLGADIAGPVGIAVITGQVVNLGFIYVLQFAALLSINLAIINILPFPALDGGRVLFLGIEKIIRRPVNQKVEAIIHNLGFIFLMILIVLVTFRDIGRFGQNFLDTIKNIF